MFKKTLLVGSAASALMAGSAFAADGTYVSPPAFAPPPSVQAHVELYAGPLSVEETDDLSVLFGGAGRANVPLANDGNLQLDAQGSAVIFSEGKSAPQYAAYAHWYRRDPGSHALGVFGGASAVPQANQTTIGVEGQVYWPQFTLYGQGSVSRMQSFSSDGWAFQLRAEGQWFVSDDTVVLGDLMWTRADLDFANASTWTFAGTLVHRFTGSPFSGFLRARYDTIDTEFTTLDEWSAVAGVRLSADPPGSTDKSHRRNGPAMDVLPAPTFGFAGPVQVSDRRLKRDIVMVDRLPNGIGLYRYRYLWSETVYVGVMAQEVAGIVPEAVVKGEDGYLLVDYSRLGCRLVTWHEWLAAFFGEPAERAA
jgi:hypothetical protein